MVFQRKNNLKVSSENSAPKQSEKSKKKIVNSLNLSSVPSPIRDFVCHTEKRNRLGHTKKKCFAPSDRKRLTVMIRKLDSNGSVTCHNRSITFLIQLIRLLETSDFLLFSNDIDHLVQVFGFYCAASRLG
jgi:hypothetical protein